MKEESIKMAAYQAFKTASKFDLVIRPFQKLGNDYSEPEIVLPNGKYIRFCPKAWGISVYSPGSLHHKLLLDERKREDKVKNRKVLKDVVTESKLNQLVKKFIKNNL